MSRVSRLVPWLLVGTTVVVQAFATASLVAMENSSPELMDKPEQVGFLYFHAVPLTFAVVGALIIRAQPRHPEGWLFGLFALMTAVGHLLEIYTLWHPHNEALGWWYGALSAPLFGLLALILLLFPDGRPPSPRWRWVVRLVCLVVALGTILEVGGPGVLWVLEDDVLSFVLPLVALALGVGSLVVRWRRASGPTRQQVKWLALAAAVFGFELALGLTFTLMGSYGENPGSDYVGTAIFVLTVCLIPAAMGMGIVRHHLYDIDKLLSRILAYGLLLVAIGLVYVGSLAVFAGVLATQSHSTTVLAVATTAVAVVLLGPMRRRLLAWADRRVYGARSEPGEMMAGLAAELAAYRTPEDGVRGLAEAARRATRARGAMVRIELPGGPDHVVVAGEPSAAGARTSVSMRVDGGTVGSITVVDPSRHGAGLDLLSKLAALAAPAAADMQTTAELQQLRLRIQAGNEDLAASRSRLARAEEEERAHLRQILRSEMLAAVVDLREGLPGVDAISAGEVRGADLEDAARRSRELAESIRSLAHDVLPAVLADRGLAAALRAHVRRRGADVTLVVPESPRLPGSLEAALYVCGRILVDAVGRTSGRAVLTLDVSSEEVRLAVTAPADRDVVGGTTRERAARLVGDRVAVLGGTVTVTSSGRSTEIRCRVPLGVGAVGRQGTGSRSA